MRPVRRRGALLGFATCCLIGFRAIAAEPATQPQTSNEADMQAQIQRLQSELDGLKQREAARDQASTTPAVSATATATTPNTSQDSVAAAVEEDSKKHTPTMDMTGITAGYIHNGGFFISSEDGNFLLHPWAYIQGRYVVNYRENGKPDGDSSTDSGFEIARLKLILDGNVFTPDLTYQFIWNTVKSGGNLSLNDAWVRYQFHNTPFALQGGQIRNPFDHEQIMFATQTMTVDRSLVDDILANGEGIVKGIDATYGYGPGQTGPIRGEIAFTDGLRNNNTSFQDFPTNVANWGMSGRVDWKLMGDWSAYDRFSALESKRDLLVFGAGADYTEAGDTSSLLHVVDAQYGMPSGLSVYGAYLGRYTKNNGGPPGTNGGTTGNASHPYTYDSTARVMVGYLINGHLEPYVRYEYLQFDPKSITPGNMSTVHDITLGANYYFYGQRAKLSANVIYLPNGCPVNDNTVNDILATGGGSNEVVFQAQFQLIL